MGGEKSKMWFGEEVLVSQTFKDVAPVGDPDISLEVTFVDTFVVPWGIVMVEPGSRIKLGPMVTLFCPTSNLVQPITSEPQE